MASAQGTYYDNPSGWMAPGIRRERTTHPSNTGAQRFLNTRQYYTNSCFLINHDRQLQCLLLSNLVLCPTLLL
ncbi:hypothetical protein FIBSPDRAFT_867312 [Athelia psychrophila]|uniref:Uncharacterized protein n=1 Tax=Athelia psychrophila TaxID=1759441 RepID=A0A166E4B5_9AGAM|nr:hypothetical protein FIBSPDRAFT_867312 [Fibularhizoctonia sp. CBS 109695]